MASNDVVNAQIVDAVSTVNTGVVGDAPSIAVGTLYQSLAHASGIAMFNASANQQNLNQLNPAIVSQAVAKINKEAP
jgi:intracellular sulfur oxidation DsrE/DsrF family protein